MPISPTARFELIAKTAEKSRGKLEAAVHLPEDLEHRTAMKLAECLLTRVKMTAVICSKKNRGSPEEREKAKERKAERASGDGGKKTVKTKALSTQCRCLSARLVIRHSLTL